jgi:hypothetical protein
MTAARPCWQIVLAVRQVNAALVDCDQRAHGAHPSVRRPVAGPAPGWAVIPDAANPRTHVGATVRYAARPWGLVLSAQVTGIPVGTTCQLDVISGKDLVTTAGGWLAWAGQGDHGRRHVPAGRILRVPGGVVNAAAGHHVI